MSRRKKLTIASVGADGRGIYQFMLTKKSHAIGQWLLLPLSCLLLLLVAVPSLEFRPLAGERAVQSAIRPIGLNKLPLSFEPNAGQADPSVRFVARTAGANLFFTPDGVVMSLKGKPQVTHSSTSEARVSNRAAVEGPQVSEMVRLSFKGAAPARLVAGVPLPGKANYLIGNDPAQWHTGLPTYSGIAYMGLYPGIDLIYSGAQAQLEGTYKLQPGADPDGIRWQYPGAKGLSVDAEGNLQVRTTGVASLSEKRPFAWQDISGRRVPVSASYRVDAAGTANFALGGYNHAYALTIDPTLVLSGYLGGTGDDYATGIGADADLSGFILVGNTHSLDFPLHNPLQPQPGGGTDIFAARFNAQGTALIYSTYIGGSGDDVVQGSLFNLNTAWIAGKTTSPNFPTVNAYQSSLHGPSDAFGLILDWTGSSLFYSTYLGGSGADEAYGIENSDDAPMVLVGKTNSIDFPLVSASQTQYGGGASDVFASELIIAAGRPPNFSTYLGSTGDDEALAAGLAGGGEIYVTGRTTSPQFPTLNAYQPLYGGNGDAFVTMYHATTSVIGFSTFLGGSGPDVGRSIYASGSALIFVAGDTASPNFPTVNAYQSHFAGGVSDGFITHVGSDANTLSYSTYLGGSGEDSIRGIQEVIGSSIVRPIVTGYTNSLDFPS
ncbi:MAG: hypothetical protein M3014_14935 [Chloroflexota bacterium]|nr:hypothetical protein [Chloroflexota bacterium]